MNNPFKKLIQQYLYFSKKDRNANLILIVLIFISIVATIMVNQIQPKSKYNYAEFAKLFEEWEMGVQSDEAKYMYLFEFDPNSITKEKLDTLLIPENIKRNIINYRNAGGSFSSPSQLKKIYGMNDSIFNEVEKFIQIHKTVVQSERTSIKPTEPISGFFNPNNATLGVLSYFGFNQYQSNNLINYRNKGGIFYTKNDLLRIYGIDSLFFKSIEKHIQIDSIHRIEKSEKVINQLVEINCADEVKLMELKGIGKVYAARIIKYRDLLGGFHSKNQLLEVYNFPSETFAGIENQVLADTLLIKKIRINFAEYNELIRHPYFNKQQVNAILEYRNINGAIKSEVQVQTILNVDNVAYSRILPYISCR